MKKIFNILYHFWTASITRQLVLGITVVHAVLMTIFVVDLVERQKYFMLEQSTKEARGLALTLAANGTSWVLSNDIVGMEEVINSQGNYPGLRFAMFLNMNGRVLGYTDKARVNSFVIDEVSRKLINAPAEIVYLQETPFLVDVAAPVMTENIQVGWARVAIDRGNIIQGVQLVTRNGLIYTVIAILVGILFASLMARGMTTAIRDVGVFVASIANGSREISFQLDRKDELGKLCVDVGMMLKSITKRESELVEANKHRKEIQNRLLLTLNSIGDGVIVTDNDGKISMMNPVAENLTGWNRADAAGRDLDIVFNITNDAGVKPGELIEKVVSEGVVVHLTGTTILLSKDNNEYQITDSVAPIVGENGITLGIILVFNNVTEEMRIQKELDVKEKENKYILENMVDGVITINERGEILSYNKSAELIFGYKAEEVAGKNISLIMPAEIASRHDSYIKEFVNTGKISFIGQPREVEGVKKNGEKVFLLISVAELPPDHEGKKRFVGSCIDITLQKKQEELLNRSQKMDALGKITSGIAHDYNNMLGVIMGYSELLKMKLNENSTTAKYADEIYHAAEKGKKMTSKLLSFTRKNSENEEVVNINDVIVNIEDVLRKSLTAVIDLSLDLCENPGDVMLSRDELEDLILNMAINSKHAMANGGKLTLKTELVRIDTKEAEKYNLLSGEYMILSVIDNGSGIDPDIQEKIFDPFFTTKEEKGTGLGLSQVFGFVKRSNGVITLYSELDKGTQFNIYFPVFKSVQNNDSIPGDEVQVTLDGNETILVVDDEQSLRELAMEILSARGYNVLTASNGEKAIEMLSSFHVDMLVTDVIMPNMDGFELAAYAKKEYPQIKILVLTGFSDKRDDDESLNITGNIMYKPYRQKDFLEKIRSILDSSVEKNV